MEIVFLVGGVIIGVVGTLFVQFATDAYREWKRKRGWLSAGKHWRDILDRMLSSRSYTSLTPEQRTADLKNRFSNLLKKLEEGEPITLEETLAQIDDRYSSSRMPESELAGHRERIAQKERAAAAFAKLGA